MASLKDLDAALRDHCGICGASIEADESCIALVQTKDSLGSFRSLGPFNFPNTEYRRLRFNETFGSSCDCTSDSAVVHNDCFDAARLEGLDKDRIWTAANRASPWRGAPPLRLGRDYIPLDSSPADGPGLRRLRELPSELVALVYEYSSDSLFWRYNACRDTARRLRASAPEVLSISVSMVLGWERGMSPSLASQHNERVKVRLTIDSFGLKRIEKFEEEPRYQQRRTGRHAFIILEPHEARITKVHFKFQNARLQLHATCRGFHIWDTSSRPSPVQYFLSPDPMQAEASIQLRTIELDKITGLTFFVDYTDIYAIHVHTPSSPSAGETCPLSSQLYNGPVLWIYVPIPEGDSVTAIGMRKAPKTGAVWLLFRLRLAGDIVFGLTGRYDDGLGPFKAESSPATLIHDIHRHSPRPISVLGVRGDGSPTTPICPLSRPVPGKGDLRYMHLAYSSAPLRNIQRLRVFRNAKGSWRGILLSYRNGAQRSVGQCRLGVDDSTPYDDPRGICLFGTAALQHAESGYNDEFNAGDAVIRTGDACEHGSPWLYRCWPLIGELGVWFSGGVARINVIV